MRKYVVSVLTSLDGFYKGEGKNLDPLPMEDAFNTHNLDLLRAASTLVFGSNWFVDNWTSWTRVADDASASKRDHETARLVRSLDSLVISDSMTILPDDPWASTTRVVPRAQASEEITRLKQGEGGDLLTFASSTTWNPLLTDGLVDELIVLVGAALMGDGTKVYTGPRAGLHLLEARVLPGSDIVALHYDATLTRKAS